MMMQFFYIMDLPNYGKPYKVTKCNEILLMIQKSCYPGDYGEYPITGFYTFEVVVQEF